MAETGARPRNLLFLFSDQHARRVAGCYGDPVVATPNLDRLAAKGVAFDGAICPSPICVPSRMSMLTARHPCRQECWTNDDILPSHLPTWAHALGAGGRRPVLIGRLHAMGPDQLHGYAERHVGRALAQLAGNMARHAMGALAGCQRPRPAVPEPIRPRPHRLRREGRGGDAGCRRLDRGRRG